MSRMTLLDKDDVPKTFKYTYEIMCEWCFNRLEIYTKRKALLTKEAEERLKFISLKYQFVMDVVEGRLDIRGKKRVDIIPYMKQKGYPCGEGKTRKQRKAEEEDDEEETVSKKDIKARRNADFLTIPLNSITYERAQKLKEEYEKVAREYEYYKTVFEEDLWLADLDKLDAAIAKEYSVPLY